ncbi:MULTISPECIES: MATE family efflux transporter [Paenibacillus]|uniref:MATE family efflux transporter n=1 Tax=Paenibacillus TaxID=44249 RepID=UPI00020D7C82|nr:MULTISPECIES: MATE family efflux transporter [Paenibacillus]EGL15402.1 MATE efflux family protein [Paenibacillus sp. HGF7]EPD81898.1 MATE efflux family protein [Paenibacillus sp. HGH0039]MBV6713860.1 MATE family efflux transporter [Paenibacillus chitinolyticus]
MFTNWGMILRLAVPSIVSFAAATLTGTINLMMVGPMGALVIAAVGICNIIMYNAWAACSGIGHTVNYLVAQNFGAGDMKKGVERTYIALYLCLALIAVILAAGWFGSEGILRLMGSSEELVAAGKEYLELRFYAMAFSVLNFVLFGFLRGIGDTRSPMALTILGNAAMIVFTYGLTYGHLGFPELGLPGAGLAVLIGEAICSIGSVYIVFFRLHDKYRTRTRVKLDRREARLIAGESGKLGMQEFAMSLAMFVFTMFVTRLGTEALAANEIALNVMALGFMPAFAFASTATILVGREVGKHRPDLARRYGTDTAVLGSICLLVLGAVEFVFAVPIARLYSQDPEVYALAADLIRISAFLQLFDGLLNFYAGGLRGIGDTTFLLGTSLVLSWVFFVPLAYLLTFVWGFGSAGAWISLYAFIAAFGLAVMYRFYRTDWAAVRIKEAEGR